MYVSANEKAVSLNLHRYTGGVAQKAVSGKTDLLVFCEDGREAVR
jgi:hypothetical protein